MISEYSAVRLLISCLIASVDGTTLHQSARPVYACSGNETVRQAECNQSGFTAKLICTDMSSVHSVVLGQPI